MTHHEQTTAERQRFGDYLAGFTDGEGSFQLWKHNGHCPFRACFVIALRDDDMAILEAIQAYLGCGRLYRDKRPSKASKPMGRFIVKNLDELTEVVIPHFEAHPLRAKKRRDFAVWREAVAILHAIKVRQKQGRKSVGGGSCRKATAEEVTQLASIRSVLKDTRTYHCL